MLPALEPPPSPEAAWKRLLAALAPHRDAGLVVAFSGGLDSAVLLDSALTALGNGRVVAFTAVSPSLPALELQEARRIASELGAPLVEQATDELARPGYVANAGDRCYHCKSELFEVVHRTAHEMGLHRVAYGYHKDDDADDRPGLRAAQEAGAIRPLWEAGLRKSDLRAIARWRGRSFAGKGSSACLASRIPVGTAVTPERLGKVEALEVHLRGLGFRQVRARLDRDDVVRIEAGPAELPGLLRHVEDAEARGALVAAARASGVKRVSVDLAGYARAGES